MLNSLIPIFIMLSLYDLWSSLNIFLLIKSSRMRWAGYVACMGKEINAYRVLVGKYEDRRPVGGCNHRWDNSIKMDLKTIGWDSMA